VTGVTSATRDMVDFFNNHPEHGYRLYKMFDQAEYNGDFNRYFSDLKTYCLENKIDEIYCSLTEFNAEQAEQLVEFTDREVLRLKFIPSSVGINLDNFKIDFYGYLPVYIFRPIPLDNQFNKIFKRTFDIVFSIFIFVFIFSWLFPIIAIAIKLNSKGPVFFKQKRSGRDNDNFGCYKFRSMYYDLSKDVVQATKGDSRITSVGAFLRKTSLDELPQFLNVLLGDMSVVGPRPHPLWLNDKYRDNIEKYMVRHFIKPGITGLAQVKGFRGETTDPVMMERRIKMDIFYLENWSFLLDIKIIFMTVFSVMKGDKNAF
jgi:Undecaprenyl-phosphate glucose phosphotransferase